MSASKQTLHGWWSTTQPEGRGPHRRLGAVWWAEQGQFWGDQECLWWEASFYPSLHSEFPSSLFEAINPCTSSSSASVYEALVVERLALQASRHIFPSVPSVKASSFWFYSFCWCLQMGDSHPSEWDRGEEKQDLGFTEGSRKEAHRKPTGQYFQTQSLCIGWTAFPWDIGLYCSPLSAFVVSVRQSDVAFTCSFLLIGFFSWRVLKVCLYAWCLNKQVLRNGHFTVVELLN